MRLVPVGIAVLVAAGVALFLAFSDGEDGMRTPPDPEPTARADSIPPPLPDEARAGETPEPTAPRIEGRVVGAGGAPVAGARVAAYPPGLFSRRLLRWEPPAPTVAAVTDAEGRFALDLPNGRKWLYCVDAPGYFRQWTEDPAHIRLTAGRGERSVLVLDESGLPLTNATAVLYRFHLEGPPLCEPVRADRDGKITVRVVAGLDWLVRAPGYADGWVSCLWRSGSIRLKPGLALAGAVVDSDRRAIPGAEVLLDHHDGVRPDEITTTDAQGCFRFDGLEKRRKHYTLTASRPGFSTRSLNVRAGNESVELSLLRPGSIHGAVALPDGTPAAGAKVASVLADEEGRFRFEGVTPGTHTLTVTAELLPGLPEGFPYVPRYVASVPVTIREGEAAEGVEIRLREEVYSYVVLKLLRPSGDPESEMYVHRADRDDHRLFSGEAKAGRYLLVVPVPSGTRVSLCLCDFSFDSSMLGDPLEPTAKLDVDLTAVTSARPDVPERVVRLPAPARIDVRVLTKEGAEYPPDAKLMITLNTRGEGDIYVYPRLLNHREGGEGYGYVHPDRPFVVGLDEGNRHVVLKEFPAPGGDKTVEVRTR